MLARRGQEGDKPTRRKVFTTGQRALQFIWQGNTHSCPPSPRALTATGRRTGKHGRRISWGIPCLLCLCPLWHPCLPAGDPGVCSRPSKPPRKHTARGLLKYQQKSPGEPGKRPGQQSDPEQVWASSVLFCTMGSCSQLMQIRRAAILKSHSGTGCPSALCLSRPAHAL